MSKAVLGIVIAVFLVLAFGHWLVLGGIALGGYSVGTIVGRRQGKQLSKGQFNTALLK